MPGRNKLPWKIIDGRKKSHLTKAQKRKREKHEIKMADGKIVCPMYVVKNHVAYKKWRESVKELKAAGILKPIDVGELARYCMLYSEWVDLLEKRKEVSIIKPFSSFEEEEICDELGNKKGKATAKRIWAKIEYIFSVNGVLTIDNAINKKSQVLLSLGDRLGFNILARTKITIPEKENEKPEPNADEQVFG